MVKYLKTKKGYFYKFKKNGKKKRISQEEYNKKNKTRKNKIIGGGVIEEKYEDTLESEFKVKDAIINYGKGPISTYNLVNCIAIGGIFTINNNPGTFLTHESPRYYPEQQLQLANIKKILNEKQAIITKIILFSIDEPSTNVYENEFLAKTTEEVIQLMIKFSTKLFKITPTKHEYSCDIRTRKCGKVILSPENYIYDIIDFRDTDKSTPSETVIPSSGDFIVNILFDKENGNKKYECPHCGYISGIEAPENPYDTSKFQHKYGCINQNKIPIEPVQKLDEV